MFRFVRITLGKPQAVLAGGINLMSRNEPNKW